MKILVLQGSPRLKGNTVKMVEAFAKGAAEAGHEISVVNVFKKKIGDCTACEHCHTKGHGECIQKDGMQEIYPLLMDAKMLLLASPIYYHSMSGQLRCAIDRFYACAYPAKPPKLRKVAMLLNSGAPMSMTARFIPTKMISSAIWVCGIWASSQPAARRRLQN